MLTSNGIGNSTVKIGFGNNGAIDAFGRMRVSEPAYRFDSQLTYQIDSDLWDTVSSGVGSYVNYDSTNRMASLSGAATSGSYAIMQSHYCPPYTPGRSQLGLVTFLLGTGTGLLPSGVSKKAGMYDYVNQNGVYLEQTVSGLNFTLRGGTSYPTQVIPQTGWNVDRLDGSGPSRLTFDSTKTQIMFINYQALYVGRVMVGFDIDGEIIPAHQFTHANKVNYPYIKNANLPVHYSVSTNAATGVYMNAICASVISEGGDNLSDIDGRTFSTSNGNTSIGVTTRRPILSIQCSGQLNGINCTTVNIPTDVEVFARTNDAYIEIVRNGTLVGSSFTPVNSQSSTLRDVAATSISNGTVVYSFFAPTATQSKVSVSKGLGEKIVMNYSHLLGSGDVLSVVATSRNATSDCHAALTWQEIR